MRSFIVYALVCAVSSAAPQSPTTRPVAEETGEVLAALGLMRSDATTLASAAGRAADEGDFDLSRALLVLAMRSNPDDAAAPRLLARFELAVGEPPAALAAIERLLSRTPRDEELLLSRARALARAGHSERARDALSALRRAATDRVVRAAAEDENAQADVPSRPIEEAPSSRPSEPASVASARAELASGDLVAARRGLVAALVADPSDEPARRALDALLIEPFGAPSEEETTSFSLGPAGLRIGGEILPLGARESSVKLRALRVAAGSPRATLVVANTGLAAGDLGRALNTLAAAGFFRVGLR